MNIECMYCEEIYNIELRKCSNCKKSGGFSQHPTDKVIDKIHVHLQMQLLHDESNNRYIVKEIQANGLIVKMLSSAIPQVVGKNLYISNSDVKQYKVVKNG